MRSAPPRAFDLGGGGESRRLMRMDELHTTAVYVAMTRPTTMFGVPISYVGITGISVGVALLLTHTLLVSLIYPPLHVFGVVMARRDMSFMEILLTRGRFCPRTANRFYWKVNSYEA